ncbi:MAG: dephospho-CoA kinase [Tannerellaceae bacterium]|jgi:dephospho-CoA kinase|nr:dephospho-CoA kinase [Tannerellaceae bacterium]
MIRIGLTGGIGSGKSVVAALLEVQGVPVYVADTESKRLTNTSPAIRSQLIALLGESIYTETGIDRRRMADCIFNDPECLKQVNAIIHPEVNRHFLAWVTRQTTPLCALETAILFESGFHHVVDYSVMVYAPFGLRVKRAMSRDGLSREEVVRRINNQLPDELKKTYTDYIIYNDERHALLPQLNTLLAGLL